MSLALQTLTLGALPLEKSVRCWQAQAVAGEEMQPLPANACEGARHRSETHSASRMSYMQTLIGRVEHCCMRSSPPRSIAPRSNRNGAI